MYKAQQENAKKEFDRREREKERETFFQSDDDDKNSRDVITNVVERHVRKSKTNSKFRVACKTLNIGSDFSHWIE